MAEQGQEIDLDSVIDRLLEGEHVFLLHSGALDSCLWPARGRARALAGAARGAAPAHSLARLEGLRATAKASSERVSWL